MIDSKDNSLLNFGSGQNAIIKVIGVGGGGNNAVNRMIDDNACEVEYIALNTDYQVLSSAKTDSQIQLGQKLTRGLGAGGRPEVGKKAAEESSSDIEECLEGADVVFVTAGMGGGTGTGAAPIIAGIAREKGILTIGVVTKPFKFEGKRRMKNAVEGIIELKKNVDTLIVVPNQKLLELSNEETSFEDSFRLADEVLRNCVSGIANIVSRKGTVNVDFADVQSIMKDSGIAHTGIGHATGKNRAELAIQAAINSPLLETSIKGAKNILINFVMDKNTTVNEVAAAVEIVNEAIEEEDAEVLFGANIDPNMSDEILVTLIATGLDDNENMYEANAPIETRERPKRKASDDGSFFNQPSRGDYQSNEDVERVRANDTIPRVEPVTYKEDYQQEVSKRGGFKINDVFLGGNISNPFRRDDN